MRDKNTKWYTSLLSKQTDLTYPHTVYIIRKLEDAGLVTTKKKGRTRYVELTERGEEVAIALENAYRQLKRIEEENSG